jgi:hypothetical protein
MSLDPALFSPDYSTARDRFHAAAAALGCRAESFPVAGRGPSGEELTVDAAWLGEEAATRVLVLSSGLHGVEGFFGSAVQLACLRGPLQTWQAPPRTGVLLLHAVNPFAFAHRRRADEGNVDLNRNFLLPGEEYRGSPPLVRTIRAIFDPSRPPRRFDLFWPRAGWLVLRHGLAKLREALPQGQYDFPDWLFYGGRGPAPVHQLVGALMRHWLGRAEAVTHLDFHTGLGPWATYKLLVETQPDWWAERFGADAVERPDDRRTAYRTRGDWGVWCENLLPDGRYRYTTAEFGTYPLLRIVRALVNENRAFHAGPTDPRYEWTRRELVEAFAPSSGSWRATVLGQAVALVERALGLSA